MTESNAFSPPPCREFEVEPTHMESSALEARLAQVEARLALVERRPPAAGANAGAAPSQWEAALSAQSCATAQDGLGRHRPAHR